MSIQWLMVVIRLASSRCVPSRRLKQRHGRSTKCSVVRGPDNFLHVMRPTLTSTFCHVKTFEGYPRGLEDNGENMCAPQRRRKELYGTR